MSKNKTHKKIGLMGSALIAMGLAFVSCEKVINPELESAAPVLVVEAWLTDKSEKQIVQLTMTQPYFDTSLPTGVSGATVVVTDDLNNTYTFTDDGTNTGTYQWTPAPAQTIGVPGTKYTLSVQSGGETFQATSQMKRTAQVDSITFSQKSDFQFPDGSYVAEFWGKDPEGTGDTYWIQTYKNKVLLDKPSEISLAYDAGFTEGGKIDGIDFIPPIRQSINPRDKNPNKSNQMLPPYVIGDSVYVEIRSLTLAAFDHLQQVKIQTNRNGGFGALFARPIDNVTSNIFNANASGSKVVGFFNVSAVKGLGKKLN